MAVRERVSLKVAQDLLTDAKGGISIKVAKVGTKSGIVGVPGPNSWSPQRICILGLNLI